MSKNHLCKNLHNDILEVYLKFRCFHDQFLIIRFWTILGVTQTLTTKFVFHKVKC